MLIMPKKDFVELLSRRDVAKDSKKIDQQHSKGKLTARERIQVLLDIGSFEEYDMLVTSNGPHANQHIGDGVVVGHGTIYNRPVFVYSQDFTVMGGSLGRKHANKILKVIHMAISTQTPIIGICDSGGARIQEGIAALSGYGEVFQATVDASGLIPQISLIMGPCAGGAAYNPALTDFVFMTKQSYMFVTGPEVVKIATGESVTHEQLGGSKVHTINTGIADMVCDNDIELLLETRKFFTMLPSSWQSQPPNIANPHPIERNDKHHEHLDTLISEQSNKPYNMLSIIDTVIDNGKFWELKPNHAKNIIIGLGRIDGNVVGIVANQPMELAGCIDIDASNKAARFVRFCDAFGIPIVTFVDVPGFTPGVAQESGGILKHGAKLIYAYAESTVPKITIITRKAYGGGYIVMCSKHLKSDINYCWSGAEIAIMSAAAATKILLDEKTEEEKMNYAESYKLSFDDGVKNGYIEDIIRPKNTKWRIAKALKILQNKSQFKLKKKHGNMPL